MTRRRNGYRRKYKPMPQQIYAGGLNFNPKKKQEKLQKVRSIIGWVIQIAVTLVIAGMIVYFFGVRVSVVGSSMSPTLENGEQVLVDRFSYVLTEPKANDIIVFLPNGNENSHYYMKRVIGVPGDTIQIINGVIYVNDIPFEEEIDISYIENALLAEEPIVVGQDEYFVLGDNRNNSEDSRYANIGNVKKEHIYGKAWFVVSPLRSMGSLK